ncbi:hypothetical protein F888_00511 [Acinetobacter courvalinii]|uniref:Uncharacterized protein n=1 Tax=Acinetobacter courvalinii TaxID=280147 RepID=N9Q3J5_9GAMM|nr:hypothetical protein F888_00511 [Acinetobacter courvalinii]
MNANFILQIKADIIILPAHHKIEQMLYFMMKNQIMI